MNVVIKSEPKDMDSEELAKCLEAGADYKLYASQPFVAWLHDIDMEHWLRASADRIRTLTAEVERLRGVLEKILEAASTTSHQTLALSWVRSAARNALHGGDQHGRIVAAVQAIEAALEHAARAQSAISAFPSGGMDNTRRPR